MIDDLAGVPDSPALDGILEAVVHSVTAEGLFVLLERSGRRYVHGPCYWSRPHPTTDPATDIPGGGATFATTLDPSLPEAPGPHVHETQHTHNLWPTSRGEVPPVGTRCLVVRSDRRSWWVLQFDGWPWR